MRLATQVVVVVAAAIVGAGAVYAWQDSRPESFVAESLLQVEPAASAPAGGGVRPADLIFLSRGYAARARTLPVREAAVESSGLDVTAGEVGRRLTVEVSNEDGLIRLRTTGPTEADAVALNDAVTSALAERIRTEQEAERADRLAPLDAEIEQVEQTLAGSGGPDTPRKVAARSQYQALVTARAEAAVAPFDQLDVVSPPQVSTAAGTGLLSGPSFDAALTFVVVLAAGVQVLVLARAWANRRRTPTASADASA